MIGENSLSEMNNGLASGDGDPLVLPSLFALLLLLHRDPKELGLSAVVFLGTAGVAGGSETCATSASSLPSRAISSRLTGTFTALPLPSFSSLIELSRAPVEVVGANPESRFRGSCSSSLNVLRRAGCVSLGGALGGGMVTGMGAFAGRVSSYRNTLRPSSVRARCSGAMDIVVALSSDAGAIMHPRAAVEKTVVDVVERPDAAVVLCSTWVLEKGGASSGIVSSNFDAQGRGSAVSTVGRDGRATATAEQREGRSVDLLRRFSGVCQFSVIRSCINARCVFVLLITGAGLGHALR